MTGVVVWLYILSLFATVTAFVTIYSTDKIEYMYNEQRCFEFKHKVFFIIQKSKNRQIVSKKTFVLELLGYILFAMILGLLVASFYISEMVALIIVCAAFAASIAFTCVSCFFYHKVKKPNL